MLLARTRHDAYQYEGIKIIDVADWLTVSEDGINALDALR
jgi:hypothetical protein